MRTIIISTIMLFIISSGCVDFINGKPPTASPTATGSPIPTNSLRPTFMEWTK